MPISRREFLAQLAIGFAGGIVGGAVGPIVQDRINARYATKHELSIQTFHIVGNPHSTFIFQVTNDGNITENDIELGVYMYGPFDLETRFSQVMTFPSSIMESVEVEQISLTEQPGIQRWVVTIPRLTPDDSVNVGFYTTHVLEGATIDGQSDETSVSHIWPGRPLNSDTYTQEATPTAQRV